MKKQPQKEDPHHEWLLLQKVVLLLIICICCMTSAFSQITEYPAPKPKPNYTPNSGEVQGDLLFMTYQQDATKYYVYEFSNNTWKAKGTIAATVPVSPYFTAYNLSASGNRVVIRSDDVLTIFEFKNSKWVKTGTILPPAEYTFINARIEGNRIAADLSKVFFGEDEGGNELEERFVSIYDYQGSHWVNTYQLPPATFYYNGAYFFGYTLAFSGNHIAVDEDNGSSIRLYTFTGGSWQSSGYLTNNGEYSQVDFARDLDLEGNRLVVVTARGFALEYQYNGSEWVKKAQLNPAESLAGFWYSSGYKIFLSGNLVAFNLQPNTVLFEYKEGHWIERLSIPENLNTSLSGKNFYIDDKTTAKIYRIQGFPNTELTKILASDGKQHAAFGGSVDIWSSEAIVGAPFDNEKGNDAGAAYIEQHNGTSWNERIKLTASDAGAGDQFGSAVAISGNIAVVGAPGDDDGGEDAGAVYLFVLEGNNWVEKAKITASDAAAKDQFGAAVAIEVGFFYNEIIVGAPYDDYGKYKNAGSAYVYLYYVYHDTYDETKLIPNDPKNGDQFGKSVAIASYIDCFDEYDHAAIVVGSPFHDDKGKDSGAAYVFYNYRQQQQVKLTASDGKAYDRFGISVAIDEGNLIVGAPLSDDDGLESGSAYIFKGEPFFDEETEKCDIAWIETTKLTASDARALDRFGSAVAIADNKAIVGSSYADISTGTNAGAVYAFIQQADNWVERKKLTGNARTGDRLGYAVAISGSRVLAGAYHDDDPVKGKDAGSVYVFNIYNLSGLPASPAVAKTITQEEQKEKVIKEETETINNPLAGIKAVKIYPNPFAEKLSISLDQEQAQPVEITLMDQLGRTLYHKAFTAEESQQLLAIDLSQEKPLPSGLVFLGLKTQQGNSKWIRLLKQ